MYTKVFLKINKIQVLHIFQTKAISICWTLLLLYCLVLWAIPVVLYGKLLDAVCTRKLVELLFSAVFDLFCSFYPFAPNTKLLHYKKVLKIWALHFTLCLTANFIKSTLRVNFIYCFAPYNDILHPWYSMPQKASQKFGVELEQFGVGHKPDYETDLRLSSIKLTTDFDDIQSCFFVQSWFSCFLSSHDFLVFCPVI